MFIALEGIDGSGKATQAKLLEERLRSEGYDVMHQEFPRYSNEASYVTRQYLNGVYGKQGPKKTTLLYLVDRIDADITEIRPHLQKGGVVVSDRWVGSNMGHQSGKVRNRGEIIQFIEYIEYSVGELSKPTHTIYLRQDPLLSKRLAHNKKNPEVELDIHAIDQKHLYNARKSYDFVAQHYNWSTIDLLNKEYSKKELLTLPAEKLMKTPQEIHTEVWSAIQENII